VGEVKVIGGNETGYATTRLDALLGWARKYSLFQYPFVTACCGMEFMSLNGPRFDGLARFGAEAPRFSPRQADLMWVVGTISQKNAPVLKRIYEQMCDPKWVIAFGTCASCGGFYDNYTTVPGIDKIIPVDVYIPGCPPRPEAVIDALMLLQDKIARGDRTPGIVKPADDPVGPKLVQLGVTPKQLEIGPMPRSIDVSVEVAKSTSSKKSSDDAASSVAGKAR
jgi:NADH-quinone oxidoreductase subunit B